MKKWNNYDVEELDAILEEAISHIASAMLELDGAFEYHQQYDMLEDIRKDLENFKEETSAEVMKIQQAEQDELEREFFRSRL